MDSNVNTQNELRSPPWIGFHYALPALKCLAPNTREQLLISCALKPWLTKQHAVSLLLLFVLCALVPRLLPSGSSPSTSQIAAYAVIGALYGGYYLHLMRFFVHEALSRYRISSHGRGSERSNSSSRNS